MYQKKVFDLDTLVPFHPPLETQRIRRLFSILPILPRSHSVSRV